MNAQNTTCPNCGKRLNSGALMGLCPDCLLNTGFDSVKGSAPNPRAFVPPEPQVVERHFPRLQVIELIGQGGMGAVYKARQKQIDRIVALKILRANPKGDTEFAARFEREARALAKFHHPNIVALYEFGEADGQYYLLMEYVDGVNLRQLLDTRYISPKEALAIVPQICDALQYAHDRGVVHRDIKPENILINRQGAVKIADFGVAKILGSIEGNSKLVGTPRYMAPEQIVQPLTVDHRADIYALGVVFYQMLTGDLPAGKFEPPSRKMFIDARLDEVVLRALEKKPELRYQQVSALKTRIETLVGEVTGEQEARPRRRWPVGLLLGGVAILGCLAAGLWVFGNMGKDLETKQSAFGPDGKPLFVTLNGLSEGKGSEEEAKIGKGKDGTNPGSPDSAVGASGTPAMSDKEAIAKELTQLKGVTIVGTVVVDDLAAGQVATALNDKTENLEATMVESVYVVRTSRDTIEAAFHHWDPSGGPRTNVIRHYGVSNPDFRSFVALAYTDSAASMNALAKITERLPASRNLLNLSDEELARYKPGTPDGTVIPPYVRDFWLDVLAKRQSSFRSDGTITEYSKISGAIDVTKRLKNWDVDSKDSRNYLRLSESRYWQLIRVSEQEPSGALVLGARYLIQDAPALTVTQDLQYYVSGGYYASVSKQRISQFSHGERPGVLVWQRDYFLIPQVRDLISQSEYEGLTALQQSMLSSGEALKPSPSARDLVVSTAKAKVKAFQKAMEAMEAKNRPTAPSAIPKASPTLRAGN